MGHWGQCGLRIDVDIVFFRKKLNFFFQFFSVINMKIQLKYFYYFSIVIMVSRLGDGSLGSVWITDKCRHSFFRKKLKFFFQIFSVINMKVQLKYFYYCSIVIMVSRLGDGHWGQCGLLIDVNIVFFRKKLNFFFYFFCNQY